MGKKDLSVNDKFIQGRYNYKYINDFGKILHFDIFLSVDFKNDELDVKVINGDINKSIFRKVSLNSIKDTDKAIKAIRKIIVGIK